MQTIGSGSYDFRSYESEKIRKNSIFQRKLKYIFQIDHGELKNHITENLGIVLKAP